MQNDSITHFRCTGLSLDDAAGDWQLMEAGVQVQKQCYVCKRQEGGNPATIRWREGEEEQSIVDVPFPLYEIERKRKDSIWHFRLCHECAILLDLDDQC